MIRHTRQMMEYAQAARDYLGGAVPLLAEFIHGRRHVDGGFCGRDEESDLYYAVFGNECLLALGDDPGAQFRAYLRSFEGGEELDFMHLVCLARCWSWQGADALSAQTRREMAAGLEKHRTPDGGYAVLPESENGSIYGCFLAHQTYQDLELTMPDAAELLLCLERLATPDGAAGNDPGQACGTATATVGAILVLTDLGQPVPRSYTDWLLCRQHPDGGVFSSPDSPVPDLLSTATSIYALRAAGVSTASIRERTLSFVESLWHEDGGFCGQWHDEMADCEYTYYGLLTIGCLESVEGQE